MCTGKEYLELVSFLAQAKPPKPQELRPCNQHEILLQLICHRKEPLSKSQLADLLWNMTTGPKRKFKRRQCGGMEGRNPLEPTDVEVVFGKKETECGNSTKKDKACEKHGKKDQAGGREKDRHKERTRTRTKRKLPGFWALLPFSCGSNLTHDSSSQDVPHRRKSS
uniref:GG16960 n=1 Tax=Drosophila erecta TaxID=7220 RepID=B3P3W7_DROER